MTKTAVLKNRKLTGGVDDDSRDQQGRDHLEEEFLHHRPVHHLVRVPFLAFEVANVVHISDDVAQGDTAAKQVASSNHDA